MVASVACALVSEGINWFFIYRHDDYKKLCRDLQKAQAEMEDLQTKSAFATGGVSKQRTMKIKLDMLDKTIKSLYSQVMGRKSKSGLVVAGLMAFSISMINKQFYGTQIAVLPFEPISMIQNLTHYGLEGEDFRACSTTFLFILSNMSLGTYVKRSLSLEGPRSVTQMNPPMPKFLQN